MRNTLFIATMLLAGTLVILPCNRLAARDAGLFIRPQLQAIFPKDIKEGLVLDLESGYMAEDDDWSCSLDGGFYSSRDGEVEVEFVELNARVALRWFMHSDILGIKVFEHNLGFLVSAFGGYRWLTMTPGADLEDINFSGPHFGLEAGPVFRLNDNFCIELPVAYSLNTAGVDDEAGFTAPNLNLNAFSARLALCYVFR